MIHESPVFVLPSLIRSTPHLGNWQMIDPPTKKNYQQQKHEIDLAFDSECLRRPSKAVVGLSLGLILLSPIQRQLQRNAWNPPSSYLLDLTVRRGFADSQHIIQLIVGHVFPDD